MNNTKSVKEYIEAFVANDRLGSKFNARPISLNTEECVYEYEAGEEDYNPKGILHGGALYAVMDSSQGMLMHYILDDTFKTAATGTATVKYLAPVRSGKITIRTKLISRERRKFFVHSDAVDANGNAVATLDEIWIAIP